MKKKLTRNIGLKILSLILAAIIWLVITNVDDPVVPLELDDVPVKILNEYEVTSLNPAYEIIDGRTVDFKIKARRSIRDRLSEDDFRVTADFAHLSDTNSVNINISCPRYEDDVVFVSAPHHVMKIRFEPLVEEKFAVDIRQNGGVPEGYFVSEKTASPNIIYITGPKSKIEQISKVVVEVDVDIDVDAATRPIYRRVKPKALDEEGNEVDPTKLTFSDNYISVVLDIYRTKQVRVQINPTGEPADGYIYTKIVYQPEMVTIAGSDEKLNSTKYITRTIDINGARTDIETEITMEEDLKKEGIFLVGEDKTIAVKVTIEKLETKDISMWPSDIELRNKSSLVEVEIVTVGPIEAKVVGPSDEMVSLSRSTLKPYIDLSGFTTSGTYPVALKSGLSDKIEIYDTPKVVINIIR